MRSVCRGSRSQYPVLLGLAGAIGATIGELSGYLAGYTGKVFVRRSKRYARISHWVDRNGFLPLFVLAAIPNPFFDLVGIAAGSLGYSIRRFLLFVLAGETVKFVAIVYACRIGVDWIVGLV